MSKEQYVKLEVYVPLSHSDKLKTALFETGAGKLGNYDCCCFEVTGTGQFRPLEGSEAFIGQKGSIEKVEEVKLEMLCPAKKIKDIVKILKATHPYETPAFDYWPVKID